MEKIGREVELVQQVGYGDGDLGKEAGKASSCQQWILNEFQRPTDKPGSEWNEKQGQQSTEVGEWKTNRQGDVDRPVDLIATHFVVPIELLEILDQER